MKIGPPPFRELLSASHRSLSLNYLSLPAMPYSRYVEVGRICVVNYGPDAGSLCTIVEVVDQNKCLVDGPRKITGVGRGIVPFKRLALTDLKVGIERGATSGAIASAFGEADIIAKWETTSWAKKNAAKKRRASLNDFERFKVMVARKAKAAAIKKAKK